MISQDATDVLEESRLDVGGDLWQALFGAEYEVAMERTKRLRHGSPRTRFAPVIA